MSLDPMKTVREAAVAIPNATRVFEKTRIDYCCGGDQLLGAACARAGVDLQTLERMLEMGVGPAPTATVDFQRLSLAELVQYILDKHTVYPEMKCKFRPWHESRLSARIKSPGLWAFDPLEQMFAELRGHIQEGRSCFRSSWNRQSVSQQRPVLFARRSARSIPSG
jgi:hypothetical protein